MRKPARGERVRCCGLVGGRKWAKQQIGKLANEETGGGGEGLFGGEEGAADAAAAVEDLAA